jgi:hypothetical protein
MLINNLPLPALLLELIAQNRWGVPENADEEQFAKIFKHGSPTTKTRFFNPKEMKAKTNFLLKHPEEYRTSFFKDMSSMENKIFPKYIEPEKAIIIIDLYNLSIPKNPDMTVIPICLDYRTSSDNPCVIMYPDDRELYWMEISPTFEQFVKDLKL